MGIKVKNLPVEITPALTDSTINDSANVTTKITTWQSVLNLFIANGVQKNDVLPGISAAGTNQSTATILTKTFNRVDTVASGTGVKNDVSATVNFRRTIQNNGANDLLYYPFLGNNFLFIGSAPLAANVPITISPGNQASVLCYTNGECTII